MKGSISSSIPGDVNVVIADGMQRFVFKKSFGKRTQEFTNAFIIVFMNSEGQVKLE